MTVGNRIILGALWSLSLMAVSQWTASAQMRQAPPTGIGPGSAVRFVATKSANGVVTGTLMAEINGAWVTVTLDEPGGMVIRPAGGK